MSHPQPSQMANVPAEGDDPSHLVRPRPAGVPAELSTAQRRMWVLEQFQNGAGAYHSPLALRLVGPLDRAAFERAWATVVNRHEALQSRFPLVEGQPRVVRDDRPAGATPLVDLSGLDPAAREPTLAAQLQAEAQRPFDLAGERPWRTRLWRLGERDWLWLLNQHHILTDEWSRNVLLAELAACYRAELGLGGPAELPAPLQIGDFAHWERGRLDAPALREQEQYWRQRLDDTTPGAMLPPDHPRPAIQTYRGERRERLIAAATLDAARAYSKAERASPFMTLLAAWKLLVWRTTGESDVRVGSPVAGRAREELRHLLGPLLNTLALRTRVDQAPSFRQLVRAVRGTVLDALEHQELPFEQLVEALQVPRDLSRNPLFQVMFQVRTNPPTAVNFGPLEVRPIEVWNGTSKFDLTIELFPGDDGLRCVAEYNADLFDPETIDDWLARYERLLAAGLAAPEAPLAELPWTSPAEQAWLVARNDTAAEYPREATVAELFAAQAQRTPHQPAVEAVDRDWTYAELDAAAHHWARQLRAQGVNRETLVGVYLERTSEMLLATLAIWKAGGAYLPLDPAYPAQRLQFMLADSQAAFVLTSPALRDALPATSARVVLTDELAETPADHSQPPPAVPDGATARAYVIYTSGSTGQPKGVEVEQRNVVNFLLSMARQPGCGPTDRWAAVTTLSFDIHVLELYLPLLVGATVLVVPREVAADGAALARELDHRGATILQATPATWRLLIESAWPGRRELVALCGGEALPGELAEALVPRVRALWNLYGPTETTVWSTIHPVRLPVATSVPIGRPLANTRVHILDASGQPTPPGVPGELWIAGDGIARGYLHRPELTAERFVPEWGADAPDQRMYRTGDLARWNRAGELEFLGRVDQQIKLRGFRVELGEIEAALAEHPAIAQAVVALRQWGPHDARLVAYCVFPTGAALAVGDLRAHLRERLPEYMLPAAVVAVERFPLTPSGKVDRRALPDPPRDGAADQGPWVAPRTPLEEQLARLWGEVLGLERVSVTANFFELGGHSLLAVRLFAGIAAQFGVNLPLASLFTSPTVAELARQVAGARTTPGSGTLVTIRSSGTRPPLCCGTGLGTLTFEPLARALGDDQPVFAFQAPGYEGDEPPLVTVPALVERHLADLRRVRPRGPYIPVGHCFGGVLAFELACRLVAEGEQVPLLVLIDSNRPIRQSAWMQRLLKRGWARRTKIHLDALAQRSWSHRADYLWQMGQAFLDRRSGRVALSRRRQGLEPPAHGRIAQANFRAQWAYEPGAFAGPALHFIQADRPIVSPRDRRARWNELITGPIETISVPGRHVDMLRDPENARVIAAALRHRLAQVLGS